MPVRAFPWRDNLVRGSPDESWVIPWRIVRQVLAIVVTRGKVSVDRSIVVGPLEVRASPLRKQVNNWSARTVKVVEIV
jgi:hypothetical protein